MLPRVDFQDVTQIQPDSCRRPLGTVAARPLVVCAIGLIAGIACHAYLPASPLIWLIATFIASSVAWCWNDAKFVGLILILSACAMLGVATAQLASGAYPDNHIVHFTTENRRLAQVEMEILHPPRIYAPTYGQSHPMPPKQVTTARVTAVRTHQGWIKSTGDMLVQISEPNPRLRVGQIVRAFGMIDRPAPSMNPGQFDWADCAPADRNDVIRAAFWRKVEHSHTPGHNAK